MKDKQYIVYCWRYENQSVCKVGGSLFDKFYDNCLKLALRFSILDIEILGICLCNSKAERDNLESQLLNEQFDRVRSDREFVFYNEKVKDWIQSDCLKSIWTVEFFKNLDNGNKPKHRERNREYQREKRKDKALKARAQSLYREWIVKESPLSIGGPAVARDLVAEDLADQGVGAFRIQEILDELEKEFV